MKIQRIEAANFIGIARAEIDLASGVLVVSGNNAAGKSTIADAISCALLGKPRRVDAKKDLGMLLHGDAPKGRVSLVLGDGEGAEFRIPKGDHMVSEIAGAEFLPYVLDTNLFARQSADERRTMLFKLTGLKASPKLVGEKLAKRGIDQALIDDVLPVIRNGFPAAAKEAYAKSTEAKGAWRQITGENWGAVKAEGWSPERVEEAFNEQAYTKSVETLAKTRIDLSTGMGKLGELKEKRRSAAGLAEKRVQLEEKAGDLQRLTRKIEESRAQLASWQAAKDKAEQAVTELSGAQTGVACPCCQELLVIRGAELIKHDGKQADPKTLQQSRSILSKATEAVTLWERTISNDARDIATAESATEELGLLQPQAEDVSDAMLQKYQDAIDQLQANINSGEQAIKRMEQVRDARANYERTKHGAAAAHKLVTDYLALGDALAPDGIPGELLNDALAPVNQSIEILAGMAGWSPMVIGSDMDLTYGGRLYGLCSESERWRADALIALAIAQISQLRLVVLDRFDVLEPKSRPALLKMLMQLEKVGSMDTMIMCGTMKQPLAPMNGVTSVWIQNGLAETETA